MRISKFKLFGLGVALVCFALAAGHSVQIGLAQSGKTIAVCSSGCDFDKIQAAVDAAGDTLTGSHFVTAQTRTLRVPEDFPTIQGAINAAASGDLISVNGGSYSEHLEITTKNLTLQGRTREGVFLRSAGEGRPIVTIWGAVEVTIEGFTITGDKLCTFVDNPTRYAEIGVVVKGQAKVTLQNDRIIDHGDCSGVLADDTTDVTIRDSIISGNMWGIVAFAMASVRVSNNEISNNESIGVQAGGRDRNLSNGAKVTLQNNRILSNGEGVLVLGKADAELRNNQIKLNTGAEEGGGGWGVALYIASCFPDNFDAPAAQSAARVTGAGNQIPGKNEPDGNKAGDVCPETLQSLKNK